MKKQRVAAILIQNGKWEEWNLVAMSVRFTAAFSFLNVSMPLFYSDYFERASQSIISYSFLGSSFLLGIIDNSTRVGEFRPKLGKMITS